MTTLVRGRRSDVQGLGKVHEVRYGTEYILLASARRIAFVTPQRVCFIAYLDTWQLHLSDEGREDVSDRYIAPLRGEVWADTYMIFPQLQVLQGSARILEIIRVSNR